LDEIEFSSITGYEGSAVKGWVTLDELLRKKNLLESEGAFIATTGNINKGKKVIASKISMELKNS
jgi:hypothetical protein